MSKIDDLLQYYYDKFDSVDLISKMSALNLEFENQNKNPLTTYATIYGLFNQNTDKPKISNKTFKNLIDALNNSSIMPPIQDPSESAFYEDVYLDKEYKVFNGINISSAYYVNSIIELLLYRKTDLEQGFKKKAIRLIKFSLFLSDSIFHKSYIKHPIDKDHQYEEKLLFSNKLETYQKALVFDISDVEGFISSDELDKYFICKINGLKMGKCLKENYPFYYNCPLLRQGEKLLVIDPTSICYFIRNLCLKLSEESECKEKFLNYFYDSTFDYAIERCKMLSGVFPNDENIIVNIVENNHKCLAFSNGNKAILCACYRYDKQNNKNCDKVIRDAISNLKSKGYDESKIYTFIIINSYYGEAFFNSNYKFKNHPVVVPASDLEIIQINEHNNPFFLENFILFLNYYFSEDKMSTVFSITNLIGMLHEKGYDFYLNDDVNVRSGGFMLNLAFDFIYPYYVKALKEKQNSVAAYDGSDIPIRLIKYEDNIYYPNPILCPILDVMPLFVRVGNFGFWIVSKRGDDTGLLVARSLGYWLNQLAESIKGCIHSSYYVQVALVEDGMSIYRFDETHSELRYTRNYLETFENDDNQNEISMVCNILDQFGILNRKIYELLKRVAFVPYKKIIYTINVEQNPYLRPVSELLPIMRCSKIYSSMFDDYCGDYLKNVLKIKFGVIEYPGEIINTTVEYLFDRFKDFVNKFDWLSATKRLYLYSEKTLSELLLFQDNLKHQSALYPEHNSDIEKNNDELNVASVSTRFIVEYLAAVKTTGTQQIDDVDIQYAISIVETIIRWAKLSDAYRYQLIDSFVYLESGRIGFEHHNLDRFNELLSSIAFSDSIRKTDSFNYEPNDFPFDKEVEKAYLYEHGFTTKQLSYACAVIYACGEEQDDREIKEASICDLLSVFHRDKKSDIDNTTFLKILDYLTIDFRGNYYDSNIKPRELHPWKYGREWSLMRKPLVKREGRYYWGNRMLYHSFLFIMQTIRSGKEPSHDTSKNGINYVNGKILEYIGDEFNNYCFDYLKQKMKDLDLYKCVKSINNIKIQNSKKQTLGDIDILAIDKNKKRIYLIETKRFYYSRNPSELDNEIKEMFVDTDKTKSFLTKELLRKEWFEEHINDVISHFKLKGIGWKIRYTFLTYKPLLSSYFVDTALNHIDIKNISLNFLRKLK